MYHRKKKSKFEKWLYRMLFLLILLLLLLTYEHFTLAIETLVRINNDQIDTINQLQQQVNSLELHSSDLQSQMDIMKVKINGLDVPNIHNVTPQIKEQIHTVPHTNLDILKPIPIITVTAMTVMGVLKGLSTFLPVIP